MTALFASLLAVPLAAAVGILFSRERSRHAAAAVGALVAAGWLVVVAATSGDAPVVVEIGRLAPDPLLAAAAAGLALLVAAEPPRTVFATSAALTGLAVFPAAAASGPGGPDRPLAAGVLVLTVLAVGRSRLERSPWVVAALVAAGGLLVTVGLASDVSDRAAALVVAGAAAVAVVPAVSAGPGRLLLPVVLLAVERATSVPRPVADGVDPVLAAAVVAALAGALALALVRTRPVVQRLPAAGALAAIVLLLGGLPELRRAGLLLAAAAVLAAAGRHPLALLAGLPAAAAAVGAAGAATEPEHAAVGVVVLVVIGAGALRSPSTPTVPLRWRWPALPGALFGVLPVWGWAGVDLPDYTEGLAVAAAAGFVVLAAISVGPVLRRAVRRPAPTAEPVVEPPPEPRATGVRLRSTRLVARRSGSAASPDGSAQTDD